MKKILSVFFVSLLLVLTVCSCISSALTNPRFFDEARLLNDSESQMLRSVLDEKSESLGFDVVVATVDSMLFADDAFSDAMELYEYLGYGENGIMLYICMGTRDWQIIATGYADEVLSDSDFIAMEDALIDDLSSGYYYDAFYSFAQSVEDRALYDYDGDEEFDPMTNLIISLIIGFIIALIITGVWKSQLKSVVSQTRADDYIRNGSLNITKSTDLYLYRHIDRIAKPQNTSSSSSGRSSSGRSYSGRGGKF